MASYAAGEAAFAQLLGFLTSPDAADLFDTLVRTKELSPGFSQEEREALESFVSSTGVLKRANQGALNLQKSVQESMASFNERTAALKNLAGDLKGEAHEEVLLLASTIGIVETQRRNYISADAGVLYGWDVNDGLLTIDPATGTATDVNPSIDGIADIQTIVVMDDGSIYGAGNFFFSIDPGDGTPLLSLDTYSVLASTPSLGCDWSSDDSELIFGYGQQKPSGGLRNWGCWILGVDPPADPVLFYRSGYSPAWRR